MASQRLFDRFEIITRISSGILQVFLARERKSGADALVREFPVDGSGWGPDEILDKAKARLAELDPGIDLSHFADADLSADKLKAWVIVWAVKDIAAEEEVAPTDTAAPPNPPDVRPLQPAVTPPASEPGEFTRVFAPPKPAARHIQTVEPISLVGGTPLPKEAIRNVPPPQNQPMESGEFTRIFGAPVSHTPAAPPPSQVVDAGPTVPPPATSSQAKDEVRNILELFGQAPRTKDASEPTVTSSPLAPPPDPKNVPSPKPNAVGEFTRSFGAAPSAPIGEPHALPSPNADPFEQALRGAPSANKDAPGLYTQVFRAPKLTAPDPALKGPAAPRSPADPWPAAKPEAPKTAPGEFTRMFQNSEQPSGPTPSPASSPVFPGTPTGDTPGDLTQLFAMKTPSRQEPGQDPFAAFVPPPTPSGSPESLTQILSRPPQSQAQPSSPPIAAKPFPPATPVAHEVVSSGATHVFSQPRPQSPVAPATPSGPGEYTRIISAPRPSEPAPPQQPPAQSANPNVLAGAMPQVSGPQFYGPQVSGPQFSGPQVSGPRYSAPSVQAPYVQPPYVQPPQVGPMSFPASAPPTSATAPAEKKGISAYMPLIIILNVLVILAILLVAFFALRHH